MRRQHPYAEAAPENEKCLVYSSHDFILIPISYSLTFVEQISRHDFQSACFLENMSITACHVKTYFESKDPNVAVQGITGDFVVQL